ncbi:MAG: DUF2723 domain-containing protein [Patescibacteria group bacterium]|nr:DUF2723 domain-containing protein [Patescibacteria group bacterium]
MFWRFWRQRKTEEKQDRLAALLVGLVALSCYLPLLPQTVSLEDSAEFVTAAATLGILHPSGAPLYVLLAYPFAHLPFGTVPWRVALFSALCAAAAVALAYLTAATVVRRAGWHFGWPAKFLAAAVCLAVAVTPTWLSQAVYAKNYPLQALLMMAAVYAVVCAAGDEKTTKWLRWAAFWLGLAAANHLAITVLTLPFFLAAFIVAKPTWRRQPAEAAKLLACFSFGPLLYLLLPLRFAMGAPYAAGPINGFSDFMAYVLRTRYADFGGGGWNKFGLIWEQLVRPLAETGPLIAVAAVGGLVGLARLRRPGAAALFALMGVVSAAPLAVMFRSFDWSNESSYIYRIYCLPAYVAFAAISAVGAVWLFGRLRERGFSKGLVVVLAAALPLLLYSSSWLSVRPFVDSFPERYVRGLLASLPSDAVLVINDRETANDTELFVLTYLQVVEKTRLDLTVIQESSLTNFPTRVSLPPAHGLTGLSLRRRTLARATLTDPRFVGRPIFTTYPVDRLMVKSGGGAEPIIWGSRSNGFVYELHPVGVTLPDIELSAPPLPAFMPVPTRDYAMGQLTSRALYVYAGALLEKGDRAAAQDALMKALQADPDPMSADYTAFMAHRAGLMAH